MSEQIQEPPIHIMNLKEPIADCHNVVENCPGILYATENRYHATATSLQFHHTCFPMKMTFHEQTYHVYRVDGDVSGKIKNIQYRVGNSNQYFIVWNR